MFTGLVMERGGVRKARRSGEVLELEIEAKLSKELAVGDSVAVNGVCLTATKVNRKCFRTQAMDETTQRTAIGRLTRGTSVNLELPLRLSDRLGGHLVQGHVDGVGRVVRIEDDGDARRVWFDAARDLLRFLVPKGSVCIDGVSLTVVDAGLTTFEVALIPHTLEVTTLGELEVHDVVNVEVDVLAKYVERLVVQRDGDAADNARGWSGHHKEGM